MARGKQLPSPDAPLVASDGTVVKPTVASTFRRIEVPNATQAQRLVSSTRRKLADLPALPKQLNALSSILVYTASGLSDNEIALALGADASQIIAIRETEAYKQLETLIMEAARETARNDVQAILAQQEIKSAEKIGELIDSSDEKIALAASKDILDRRGHTPAQKIDIRQQMESTFRIEVVDKRDAARIINVETEV